jgi:predicted nucleic acid-binding protein
VIVVDASVIADVLTRDGEAEEKAHATLERDPVWIAPEHWKIEVLSTIRRQTLTGVLSPDQGLEAIGDLQDLTVRSIPVDDQVGRIWELRDNFTVYDAAYVALAEARRLKLVTADGRMARSAVAYCTVELVTKSDTT